MNIQKFRQGNRSRFMQQGLSLVELMIAITLGLFLIWGVTQAFLTSRQTYRLQQGLARIQEGGRMAQEFIGYDIRNAGNYGCGSGDSFVMGDYSPKNPYPDARNDAQCAASGSVAINMITAITALDDEYEYAVYGFDNVAASTTVFTGTSPAGTNVTARLSLAPKAGTDVLMVHASQDLGITTAMIGDPSVPTLATPTTFTLNTTTNQLSNTTALVDRISVSDCASTKIFGVANMTTAGATLTLSGNFCSQVAFQQGAAVRKLDAVYYFVATSGSGTGTGYSLYRQTSASDVNGNSTSVAQELLEGVEDMQLQYGIDTDGDGIIDVYKSAGDLTGSGPTTAAMWRSAWDGFDWKDNPDGNVATQDGVRESTLVRAVRYSLLLRTEDQVLQDVQTVSFNGSNLAGGGSNDKRLREVFTSTIGIRSRGN